MNRPRQFRSDAGTTLLELIVVLAIIGTLAGLVAVDFARSPTAPALSMDRLRDSAVRTGESISTVVLDSTGVRRLLLLNPDGSALDGTGPAFDGSIPHPEAASED